MLNVADDFKNFAVEPVDFKRRTGAYVRNDDSVRVWNVLQRDRANIYFPAGVAPSVTFGNAVPLCKLLSIRELFLFVLYSPPLTPFLPSGPHPAVIGNH